MGNGKKQRIITNKETKAALYCGFFFFTCSFRALFLNFLLTLVKFTGKNEKITTSIYFIYFTTIFFAVRLHYSYSCLRKFRFVLHTFRIGKCTGRFRRMLSRRRALLYLVQFYSSHFRYINL